MRGLLILLISIFSQYSMANDWDRYDMHDQHEKNAQLLYDKKLCLLASANRAASINNINLSRRSNRIASYDPFDEENFDDVMIDPDEGSLLESIEKHDTFSRYNSVSDCIESKGWAPVPKNQKNTERLAINM